MSSASARHVACYLRVSTDDQSTANQEPEAVALARAVSVRLGVGVELYRDTASGAAIVRPEWDRMRAAIRSRKVAGVVMWALDRSGRRMVDVVTFIRECRDQGVETHSVQESWLSTTGPVADLLVAVFAWVAEGERTRLIQRTRAGLDRVKREGSKSGLPVGRPSKRLAASSAADAVLAGVPVADALRRHEISPRTLTRELARRRSQKGSGGASPPGSPPDPSTSLSAAPVKSDRL